MFNVKPVVLRNSEMIVLEFEFVINEFKHKHSLCPFIHTVCHANEKEEEVSATTTT